MGLIALFVLFYWWLFKDWDRVLRNHRNKQHSRNTLGVKTYLDYRGTPREVKSNKVVSVGTDLKTGHRCVWYLNEKTGERTLAKDINQEGQDRRWSEYQIRASIEKHPYVIVDKDWKKHTKYGSPLVKGHRYREVATGNIYLKRAMSKYEVFTDLNGNYVKRTPRGETVYQNHIEKRKEISENPYAYEGPRYSKFMDFDYCLNEWNELKKEFSDRGDPWYEVANYGFIPGDGHDLYRPNDYIDDHHKAGIDMNFSKK